MKRILMLLVCLMLAASAFSPVTTALAEDRELIELTIFTLENDANSADANGYAQDRVAQVIREELGIQLKYLKSTGSTVPEQAALMMATGNYPDIFIGTMGHDYVQNMLASGKLYDLEALAKEHAPEVYKRYERFMPIWRDKLMLDPEDKLTAMALDAGGDEGTHVLGEAEWGVWLRYDMMKEIGNPDINNMTDVYEALKAMKEKFPTTPDGQSSLVLTGFLKETWGFEWGLMMPWTSGQGIYNLDGVYYTPDYSGKAITLGAPEDTMVYYTAARWYNKLYREGLFDPDAFNKLYDDAISGYNSGRFFGHIGGNDIGSAESYFNTNGNPDWIYNAYAPRADGYEGLPMWYYMYAEDSGRTWTMIPITNEYPERTMEMLDFLISDRGQELIGRGLEGETFDLVDGKYHMHEDFMAAMQNDTQATRWATGISILSPYWGRRGINPNNNQPFDYAVDPEFTTVGYTDAMKAMLKETNQTFRGEITRSKDYNVGCEWIAFAQGIHLPEELSIIREEMRLTLFSEYLAKLIMAPTEEEFDAQMLACQNKLDSIGVLDGVPGYERLSNYYEQLWTENLDFINETMEAVGFEH